MNDLQERATPGTVLRIDFHEGPIWLQVLAPPDEESRHHDTDGHFSLLYPLEEGEDPGPPVECAGQIWRRPPFLFYGILFWRDVVRAKAEVLGRAEMPPEGFRRGSRAPTDAVDFETGGGPWYVSEGGISRTVTWLSADTAELPYQIGAYWPEVHDLCGLRGKYGPLPEINERAKPLGRTKKLGNPPVTTVNN